MNGILSWPRPQKRTRGSRTATVLGAAALASMTLAFSSGAHANELLSSWSWSGVVSGGQVSGSAKFSVTPDGTGWDLVIDLSNTAAVAPTTTAQILTGLYFDVSPSSGTLKMKSAVATGGLLSSVNQKNADPRSVGANICAPGSGGTAASSGCSSTVPGGWEAAYGASGLNAGAVAEHWGIGTSGQSGVFFGNKKTGVGDANYGLAPADVGDGSGGGLTNMTPYTYASAEFVLSGLTTDQVTISDVVGTYGTLPEGAPAGINTTSSGTTPVPEPTSLTLLLVGCLGLFGARQSRRFCRGSRRDPQRLSATGCVG